MLDAKKVLIVDDGDDSNYLLRKALFACGIFEVDSVASPDDATKYLAGLAPYEFRQRPDLIFFDLKMTRMDGFEFIRALQCNPLFGSISLISLSDVVDSDQQAKAMDLGAKALYPKQHSSSALKNLVKRILTESFGEDI